MNKKTEELVVDATMENMDRVLAFVEEAASLAGCPMKLIMKLVLVLEEAYVNIVNYAYGSNEGLCYISYDITHEENTGEIRITLKDSGMPFNPLERDAPDISASAEEREIGGLGIFMIKQVMDRVSYSYENKENVLTMHKQW